MSIKHHSLSRIAVALLAIGSASAFADPLPGLDAKVQQKVEAFAAAVQADNLQQIEQRIAAQADALQAQRNERFANVLVSPPSDGSFSQVNAPVVKEEQQSDSDIALGDQPIAIRR